MMEGVEVKQEKDAEKEIDRASEKDSEKAAEKNMEQDAEEDSEKTAKKGTEKGAVKEREKAAKKSTEKDVKDSGKDAQKDTEKGVKVKQEKKKGYSDEKDAEKSDDGEISSSDEGEASEGEEEEEEAESEDDVPPIAPAPAEPGQPAAQAQWSHQEVMAILRSTLSSLTQADPLLKDLPDSITLEEVNLQIALEHGQAMTVYLHRTDGQVLPIVVTQDGTVGDLKKAIMRDITMKQKREGGTQYISWKYVWKTYHLCCETNKLSSNKRTLREYNVGNNSDISFVKRLRAK